MKTVKKIMMFAFIGMLFITCKKDVLPASTMENQPVFSFAGTIGGNTVTMQAGMNNYYMYSSYSQDSVGTAMSVYSFNGLLQSTSSPTTNCLQIIINDNKVRSKNASIAAAHIDSTLAVVAHTYNKGVPTTTSQTTGYTVKITPVIYSGSAVAYTYSWGDLTANTITTSGLAVSHEYSALGNYATKLTVQFASCGNDTIKNTLNLTSLTPLVIYNVSSSAGVDTLDTVPYTLTSTVSGGSTPYTYYWQFGDGSTSNSAIPTHYYDTVAHATYSSTLTVTDHLSNTATYNYIVNDNRSSPECLFDYSMSTFVPDTTVVTNSDFLSQVTIIYTNSFGVQYTSKDSAQSGTQFSISSVSSYKTNINNNPTEMLKVTFNCLLFNRTVTPAQISASGTAIIAVAYPQ